MSSKSDDDRDRAARSSWVVSNHLRRVFFIAAGVAALLILAPGFAEAQSFPQGVSAFNRQDYVSASRILIPLAEQGVRAAQSYLGFMFETGRGVPQNYTEAAMWYRRAAEQPSLQKLLYDLEAGMPFLFVDQLDVQVSLTTAMNESGSGRIRVVLGVSGQWQGNR
jgi:uncharacterized protein